MAFRADEAAETCFERNMKYLVDQAIEISSPERARGREFLNSIVDKIGPAVDDYPTWHPIVRNSLQESFPVTVPGERCGYKGLDHTRFFARGFITCPYPHDTQNVLDSVSELLCDDIACIEAERLDVSLYHPDATPILVRCEWQKPLLSDGTIPLSIAMPLLLEKELPNWRSAEVGETWETMREYFMGGPCGKRSSLFVNQDTGQRMKKLWEALIETGMYGPLYYGPRSMSRT